MAIKAALSLANQRFTPFTDPKAVAAYCEPILEQLRQFFAYASSRAAEHFQSRGWSPDVNLFAYEMRKDVFERLRALGADVTETDEAEAAPFTLERMALSGLLLKLPSIHLRIRKSKGSEIPPSGSEQLLGFYNWNLFAFQEGQEEDAGPLHLILLWNLDENWSVSNFWLACPRGERDGEVRCYWLEPVSAEKQNSVEDGYRSTFSDANSDVPLSPKANPAVKQTNLATGTAKKRQ